MKRLPETQLTSDEAMQWAETEWWKGRPAKDVALFQLRQDFLCMPWSEFRDAVASALGEDRGDIYLAQHRTSLICEIAARP